MKSPNLTSNLLCYTYVLSSEIIEVSLFILSHHPMVCELKQFAAQQLHHGIMYGLCDAMTDKYHSEHTLQFQLDLRYNCVKLQVLSRWVVGH